MINWIQSHLISLVLAAIPFGALAFLAVQAIKRFSAILDHTPSLVKRAVVTVLAAGLTAAGAAMGIDFGCQTDATQCLDNLTQDKIEMVLRFLFAAGSAFILHAGKNAEGKK